MSITTEAGYTAAKATAKAAPVNKTSIANAVAGQLMSLWRATGNPTQPAIPGAAAIVTNATAGALLMAALTTGDTRYIDAFALNSSSAGTIVAFDRVINDGTLNGTLLTAQAINTPALPARAPAAECDWYLEWYTDTGATAATATVAVTYTDATTSNIAVALTATMRAARMLQIVPVAGKIIASVQTVTLSVSTGTAGNFGVTCVRRLAVSAIVATANIGDRLESMLRKIDAASCLMLGVECSTTSTGQVSGFVTLMEG
jgi:hypothetical protein